MWLFILFFWANLLYCISCATYAYANSKDSDLSVVLSLWVSGEFLTEFLFMRIGSFGGHLTMILVFILLMHVLYPVNLSDWIVPCLLYMSGCVLIALKFEYALPVGGRDALVSLSRLFFLEVLAVSVLFRRFAWLCLLTWGLVFWFVSRVSLSLHLFRLGLKLGWNRMVLHVTDAKIWFYKMLFRVKFREDYDDYKKREHL